jgi:hypothetical protein
MSWILLLSGFALLLWSEVFVMFRFPPFTWHMANWCGFYRFCHLVHVLVWEFFADTGVCLSCCRVNVVIPPADRIGFAVSICIAAGVSTLCAAASGGGWVIWELLFSWLNLKRWSLYKPVSFTISSSPRACGPGPCQVVEATVDGYVLAMLLCYL